MFSGIIEELGVVRSLVRRGAVYVLALEADAVLEGTRIGDSIAVNGVCLTVVGMEKRAVRFEVMPETLKVTNLARLHSSDKVNLERSLKVGDRISGHFVTGHIDCLGAIRRKTHSGGNVSFDIDIPAACRGYIIPKGSVALDGISLTIAQVNPSGFTVNSIPHTCAHSTLGFKGSSDAVNVECDILAKSVYCQRH
jgi:riboflavin synthase